MKYLTLIVASILFSGCAAVNPQISNEFPKHHNTIKPEIIPVSEDQFPLSSRMSYPDTSGELPGGSNEALYSFMISNLDIQTALRLFSRAYSLNMIIDASLKGMLNVEFYDLPLHQAMSLMLDSNNYYWENENGLIHVASEETRQFSVDYLRLSRTGTGTSTAKVSSGGSTGGEIGGGDSGGGGNSDAGTIIIGHEDEIDFWKELEIQIDELLSTDGRVVINSLSGTIQVTDQHKFVEGVAFFLGHLNRAIHRQVDIEVQILEVTLNDSQSLGINWSRLAAATNLGKNLNFDIGGIVESPAGGISALPAVLNISASNIDVNGNNRLSAIVSALEEQGSVEIVSQPHVRTMNNQTSLIKVGTDRTFFRREQQTDSTSAGSISTATDVPQVVTEGVVLSITPQISDNGWVIMDISPVVTRVSSVSTVVNDNGVVQSSAPNLDVSQVTSMIRGRSGDTVVVGGLIQTLDSHTRRNVPGFKFLRALVGGQYRAVQRKELVMLLTPTIVAQ